MSKLLFKGGRVIDPSQNLDAVKDLRVVDGHISTDPIDDSETVIDATGLVICPGFIDLHTHLGEPGKSSQETFASGTRAAAAGGFTTVVTMPDTNPAADDPQTIAWIRQKAAETACVRILPAGALSQGRNGEGLAPIGSLFKAGIVAITDSPISVQNNSLMRHALSYASMFKLPVFDPCREEALTAGAAMHEGYWSTVLGLKGSPVVAEEMMVARNILLAETTGCHIHCQQISTAGSVSLLREAKKRDVPISGEATPHHLIFTDANVEGYNTCFKVEPPLRTEKDLAALIEGLADGTIEHLVTDHTPCCAYEKEVEFDAAPFGIVGLETAVGLFFTHLVHTNKMTLSQVIRCLTTNPARLLHRETGSLKAGSVADITVLDPTKEWTVQPENFYSSARNTPFGGMKLKGRPVMTFVEGRQVWSEEKRSLKI